MRPSDAATSAEAECGPEAGSAPPSPSLRSGYFPRKPEKEDLFPSTTRRVGEVPECSKSTEAEGELMFETPDAHLAAAGIAFGYPAQPHLGEAECGPTTNVVGSSRAPRARHDSASCEAAAGIAFGLVTHARPTRPNAAQRSRALVTMTIGHLVIDHSPCAGY